MLFKTLKILVLFMCITVLIANISGCEEKKEVKKEKVYRPVKYIEAHEAANVEHKTFAGVTQAGKESVLSFKVSGTIKKLPVSVGDVVRKGQLVGVLDGEQYSIQLQEMQASLEQANASKINANADYNRIKQLYVNRNASKKDLDAARAQAESSAANVKTMEKKLDAAKLNLSYTKLYSPISGRIANVIPNENENVNSGQDIVLVISDTDPKVKVTVPESLIFKIKKGDEVDVSFDSIKNKIFKGIVDEVGVAATSKATTFPVKIVLKENVPNMRSGLAANVTFNFSYSKGYKYFIVPSIAVMEDRKGKFVFTVIKGKNGLGQIKRKNVMTGKMRSEGIEIINGLENGDKVVIAGISKIEDGEMVKMESVNK